MINIGGLKDGIKLRHMITTYIPYSENGQCATVQFGVSGELPQDALKGVLFQKNTKMIADFTNDKVRLGLFRAEYSIEWKTRFDRSQYHEDNTRTTNKGVPGTRDGFRSGMTIRKLQKNVVFDGR